MEEIRFSNCLKFEKATEAFERFKDCYPEYHKLIDSNKDRIMFYLEEKIKKDGVFVVENDSEFFRCYQ